MKKIPYEYSSYTEPRSISRLGQIRSPDENVTQYRVTHILWVVWDEEFGCDINFQIIPEVRSMSGQIRSNFQATVSFKSIPILSGIVSGFKKRHLF